MSQASQNPAVPNESSRPLDRNTSDPNQAAIRPRHTFSRNLTVHSADLQTSIVGKALHVSTFAGCKTFFTQRGQCLSQADVLEPQTSRLEACRNFVQHLFPSVSARKGPLREDGSCADVKWLHKFKARIIKAPKKL